MESWFSASCARLRALACPEAAVAAHRQHRPHLSDILCDMAYISFGVSRVLVRLPHVQGLLADVFGTVSCRPDSLFTAAMLPTTVSTLPVISLISRTVWLDACWLPWMRFWNERFSRRTALPRRDIPGKPGPQKEKSPMINEDQGGFRVYVCQLLFFTLKRQCVCRACCDTCWLKAGVNPVHAVVTFSDNVFRFM
jgi:hypothetical protein